MSYESVHGIVSVCSYSFHRLTPSLTLYIPTLDFVEDGHRQQLSKTYSFVLMLPMDAVTSCSRATQSTQCHLCALSSNTSTSSR